MGDERVRELERAAAAGDATARAALSQSRRREGARAEFPAWRRLESAGADLFARANLNVGSQALLQADLAPLGDFAERAEAFVLDGSDPAVLDDLAEDAGVGSGMGLGRRRLQQEGVTPRDLLCALRDPLALLRLGLVYDALGNLDRTAYPEARLADAGIPRWLVVLICEAERSQPAPWAGAYRPPAHCVLSWPLIEALVDCARLSLEGVLGVLLDLRGLRRSLNLRPVGELLAACPGLGKALTADHVDAVRAALRQNGIGGAVCFVLQRQRVPLEPFLDDLVDAATASSSASGAAWEFLYTSATGSLRETLSGSLERRLEHPQAEVRTRTLRCLEHLRDPQAIPGVERVAARDRSKRVRTAAQRTLSALRTAAPPADPAPAERAHLPSLGQLDLEATQLREQLASAGIPQATIDTALDWLARPAPWPGGSEAGSVLSGLLTKLTRSLAKEPAAHARRLAQMATGLDLPRVSRLLRLSGHLLASDRATHLGLATVDLLTRERAPNDALEALATALVYAGVSDELLGRNALEPQTLNSLFSAVAGWNTVAYYQRRPALITDALRGGLPATAGFQVWASRLLAELEAILTSQPTLHAEWIESLVDLGTNTAKAKRAFAQRVLDAHGVDLMPLLVPQLSAKKGDRRANAAQWLARCRVTGALPDLAAALATEGSPKIKRALSEAHRALTAVHE